VTLCHSPQLYLHLQFSSIRVNCTFEYKQIGSNFPMFAIEFLSFLLNLHYSANASFLMAKNDVKTLPLQCN